MEILNGHYVELVLALMTFLKVVMNYIPSTNAVKIFGFVDDFINFIVKDKEKNGRIK